MDFKIIFKLEYETRTISAKEIIITDCCTESGAILVFYEYANKEYKNAVNIIVTDIIEDKCSYEIGLN